MGDFRSPPPSQTVLVAINGKKNSKFLIKWALDNFLPKENTIFKLLYVTTRMSSVPTPMGIMPMSQVRHDIADAYKQEVEWKTSEMLSNYKRMFLQRGVGVDILHIEADDIARAIANEVGIWRVNKLVIGTSSRGSVFKRKANGPNYSSKISESTPSFCTVFVVSKGKLSSVRQPYSDTDHSSRNDFCDRSSSNNFFSYNSSPQTDSAVSMYSPTIDEGSATSYSNFSSALLTMQRLEALSTINQSVLNTRTDLIEMNPSRSRSLHNIGGADLPLSLHNSDTVSIANRVSIIRKPPTHDQSWSSDHVPEAASDSPSENEILMNLELEKLRIELRHTRGMYAIAQCETLEASRKFNDLNKRRLDEAFSLKEITHVEEKCKEPVHDEEKYEDAKQESSYVYECAPREVSQSKEPETKAAQDAKRESSYVYECAPREVSQSKEPETKAAHGDATEKENLKDTLFGSMQQYKKFTWEEIVTATSSFSEKLIIGKGASGTVYKCNLHYTTAAVKVLHTTEGQSTKQFQQELEVMSKIRHPYLLLLLGACPEHGCLVYEYMENGSLEDRLLRRSFKTAPIPWFDRFRIAWEIASGLVFLHNTKPQQIIHRDLKPANILLDHNLGSKISDVGLSKMIQPVDASAMSVYNQTALVGTLSYIDPEYQRTGVNSPLSDVYAFGMVLLQLLTAKTTTALTHMVERAVDNDNITKVLDPKAGQWPLEEAKELAILGLKCAELRRRDRPDLNDHVLPTLERLRAAADKARDAAHSSLAVPPNHFLCPILKEVMNDPCVAADGYTYDRKSIEKWLEANDKSPMTNITLPTKSLITNFTLLSAILEWKSDSN